MERDTVPGYAGASRGEPSPETTRAIWDAAELRSPDEPLQQSAFNDGAHYLIQKLRGSCAEITRLRAVSKTVGAWTDPVAFNEFNRKFTLAHRYAMNTLEQAIGHEAIDALFFVDDVDDAITSREDQ